MVRMETPAPETVSLPSGPARVEFRRSARARRVSLRIDPRAGAVVVTLPPRAGRRAGMALLTSHADWVADRLAALPDAIPFADGALVPIGGILHRIRHCPERRGGVWIEGKEIRVSGEPGFLPRRVGAFLRAEARRRLAPLLAEAACRLGVKPVRLLLKDTRSRWGSCARGGTIALSWRLVLAPSFVQEYVVAHEAAHLLHMNHGPQFWRTLESVCPHRTRATAWLHGEGARLLRIG